MLTIEEYELLMWYRKLEGETKIILDMWLDSKIDRLLPLIAGEVVNDGYDFPNIVSSESVQQQALTLG